MRTLSSPWIDPIRFIGQLLENGGVATTVEDSVAEFRAYQEELERCREAIRPALESSLRGESTPLDMEDVKRRGRERFEQRTRSG